MPHYRLPSKGMVILSGNSHIELSKLIAKNLDLELGKCFVYCKANKEIRVEIAETVRGRDVYIIQTGTKNVNTDIMELMIMIYACKTSDARSITVAMPYLPYCKQSKMRKRGSIVCQLLATMLCKSGMNKLITMDLPSKEIQGFFGVPVDNLRASTFLINYIEQNISDYRNAVVVARHPAGVARATSFAERLRIGLAVIHGVEKEDKDKYDDGRTSPPPVIKVSDFEVNKDYEDEEYSNQASEILSRLNATKIEDSVIFHSRSTNVSLSIDDNIFSMNQKTNSKGIELFPLMLPKAKPPMNVVGDVEARVAIIVDDIIDDVKPFTTAAQLLHERGAYKIYVIASHGLLSSNAPQLLEQSKIDEVIVTNSIPHDLQKMQCSKIKTVDVSILMSESIRRIHNNESMSYLFTNIPRDD